MDTHSKDRSTEAETEVPNNTENSSVNNAEGSLSLNDYYKVGRELIDKQLFEEAAAVFRFLVFRKPTAKWSWYWLIVCHRELDQLEVAAQLSEAGAENCGRAFFNLAAVNWLQAGDAARAAHCQELGAAQ